MSAVQPTWVRLCPTVQPAHRCAISPSRTPASFTALLRTASLTEGWAVLYQPARCTRPANSNSSLLPGPSAFPVMKAYPRWPRRMTPRATAAGIVCRVNDDTAKVQQDPAIQERFASFGFKTMNAKPAEIVKMMESDSRKQAEVIKRAKISLE